MSTIMVLNGPNLNLLGMREPELYGKDTIDDVAVLCREAAAPYGYKIDFRQSNHEGDLIDFIHEANALRNKGELLGIVFNPGAYTHTSIALHDAIKGTNVPVIELHISNVHARESFRQHSYISPVANGIVIGMGVFGYSMAIQGLIHLTIQNKA